MPYPDKRADAEILEIKLDDKIKSLSRVRYNIWDLLADVGGFNDGLVLILSIFMSIYSQFAYK